MWVYSYILLRLEVESESLFALFDELVVDLNLRLGEIVMVDEMRDSFGEFIGGELVDEVEKRDDERSEDDALDFHG
jgi:hypothetical protein